MSQRYTILAPMFATLQRHRAFFLASAVSTLLLLSAFLIAWFYGEGLVRRGFEGRSLKVWNDCCRHGGGAAFAVVLHDLRERARGIFVSALGLWALAAAVYWAWQSRYAKGAVPLTVLGVWLLFEQVAPPYVKRLYWLKNYELIRDVDHIEVRRGPGWNADALRGAPEPEQFLPEHENLIFLGDSFTFGYRLKYEQSFPALVGELLRARFPERTIQVANFGWTSSSPLLSLRRLRAIGAKYAPDVVTLAIDMSDFKDDLRYASMLSRQGLYGLYDKVPCALKLFEVLAPEVYLEVLTWSLGSPPRDRFFESAAPLEETERWLEPLARNVQEIADWCSAQGAHFLLVVLPRSYQYSAREVPNNWEAERYTVLGPYVHEPFRFFRELASRVDYPVYSLLETFQQTSVFPTCFDDDPHWTAAGALVAAQAIAARLEPLID